MADKDKDKDNNDARWTESFGSSRDNPVLRDIKAGRLKPQLNKPYNKDKEDDPLAQEMGENEIPKWKREGYGSQDHYDKWNDSFGGASNNKFLEDIASGKLKPKLNEIFNKNKEEK